LAKESSNKREEILDDLRKGVSFLEEKKIILNGNELEIGIEMVLPEDKIKWVQDYLLGNKMITSFFF